MDPQNTVAMAGLAPGRQGSFEELYEGNFPRLVRQLYFVTGNVEEARDCMQEAFARAWLRWPRLVASTDDPVAWVSTVGYRIAVSRWRRNMLGRRLLRGLGDAMPLPGPGPDAVAIAHALSRLPHGQRVVVVLHYYEGLQVQQIANLLGLSASGVKSRLVRARKALGPMLSEEERGDA
jgi:RNA polymerase sigma-70 factor (ECF subfamily)